MPTQAEFRAAASMLRSSTTSVSAGRQDVVATQRAQPILSPTLGPLIDTALSVSVADLDLVGTQIEALASLCDERATVCADHEEELRRWAQRQAIWRNAWFRWQNAAPDEYAPWPGPAPVRPTAPFHWVDPK